jgi:acyl-CoA synthetase (NDP forming)
MISKLERIFNADSIAILGASETPGKAGERRTRSLIEAGYGGKIYPVNPKRDTLFQIKAYPSLIDIENNVDLVVAIIPVDTLTTAVTQSVARGASGMVIITAGLGETGEAGKKVEEEIFNLSRKDSLRIIGPNCSGIFNAEKNINILGIPNIQKGYFSVVAQSGNVIDSLTHYARLKNLGFSKIASVGNAIDVGFAEYLEFLRDDPYTKVILLYMEGIKDGTRFIEVAREVSAVKPIVAIKVGRSDAGKRAAATHTGSVTGNELVVEAAFKKAGIIQVHSIDEMFDIGKALIGLPGPEGRRAVVLSEGGGDNSITVDNAVMQGLDIDVLNEKTQDRLKPFLLAGLKPTNPVDYGGTGEENPHKIIPACCEVCMDDEATDMILITGFFGGYKDIIAPHVENFEKEASAKCVELVKKYHKPILVQTSFADEKIESLRILEDGGIPVVRSSERLARYASIMVEAMQNQRRLKDEIYPRREPSPDVDTLQLIEEVKKKRSNLLETESRSILEKYGISQPPARLVKNKKEAAAAAKEFGYPLILKICSPDIIHKSDIGGVKIGLRSRKELVSAFDDLMGNALKVTSLIEGALLLPMMPPGEECIVGMVRDEQFGPVLMFGLGGIFTEILNDFSLSVLPVTSNDINDMITGIRGFPLLNGTRGRPPKDLAAIKHILERISDIAIDYPDIWEIDLNPVVVYEKGASILDSRIIVRQ